MMFSLLLSLVDVVTYLLFIFLVLLTITWQLWSKVGNGHYGFVCLVQPNELGGCVGQAGAHPLGEKKDGKDIHMTMEMTSTMPQESCLVEGHNNDDVDDGGQQGNAKQTNKRRRRKAFAFKLNCNPQTIKRKTKRKVLKGVGGHRRKAYRCRYCNKRADYKTTITAGGTGTTGVYEQRGAAQNYYHYCKTTARTKHTMVTTEANERRGQQRRRKQPEDDEERGKEYEDTRTESTYIDYISRKSDGGRAAAVIEY